MAEIQTMRTKHELLRAQLLSERSSFEQHWRDCGDYVFPRRLRFYTSDINKGDRRNQKIIDNTATLAARTLRAGMMGGITSPARPWFKLSVADPEMNEVGAVKDWLHKVSSRMSTVFLKSNLYNVLPITYGDVGGFGTAALYVEEDFEDIIRFYPLAIGSYCIGVNEKLRVDVFTREFKMTVRQIVSKFGRKEDSDEIDWTNISDHVRRAFEAGHTEKWIDVVHIIRPNEYFNAKKLESKFKRFLSCYYEKGTGYTNDDSLKDKLLSEKGYEFFPVLAPRWETTGEDAYGTACPGMDTLADNKQLQQGERRIAQATELVIRPPMKGASSLRSSKSSILPGDMTFAAERDVESYKPAFQIDPRIGELEQKQEQIRKRISRGWYEDLFLMLAQSDRREITAREIDERREEKLLALGPVLEQLNQDLLDPLISITYALMLRRELIPEPPDEIADAEIRIEYISIMAQAQKAAYIGNLERIQVFGANMKAAFPEYGVEDKLNLDQMLDVYADTTSQQPGVIRTDEEVQAIRDSRAQAQAAQQKADTLAQGAKAAQTLSQTDMEKDSALSRLLQSAQAGDLSGIAN